MSKTISPRKSTYFYISIVAIGLRRGLKGVMPQLAYACPLLFSTRYQWGSLKTRIRYLKTSLSLKEVLQASELFFLEFLGHIGVNTKGGGNIRVA